MASSHELRNIFHFDRILKVALMSLKIVFMVSAGDGKEQGSGLIDQQNMMIKYMDCGVHGV